MRRMINSDPLDFEGLIHNQKMQRAAAQLPSGQNKKRPPLTMEPSTDDPLAAVKGIMRHACITVNNPTEIGGVRV